MRVHSLVVTAFGPFASTVKVDLDVLSRDGLFLLCGPTGAGKTSLLDAIAFALYGRVPGARGQEKRLRSDHASGATRTEVVCELTLRGERVRITRRPEQERPKARGPGMTKDQALLHVQRQVAGAWEPVSIRLDEGGDYLRDQIGLSAEQFWQVVLLPQGEFAEFLRAEPDQRARVLETLFDASRFTDVEDWLAEHARTARAALSVAEESVDRLLHRVEQAARGPTAPAGCVEVLPRPATDDPPDIRDYVASQLARAESQLGDAIVEDAATLAGLRDAETGRDRGRRAVRAAERLLAVRRVADSLDAGAGSLAVQQARHAVATAAEPLRPLLEAHADVREQLRECAAELSGSFAELTGLDIGVECPVRLRTSDRRPTHGRSAQDLDLIRVSGTAKAGPELGRWGRNLRDEVARLIEFETDLDLVERDELRLAELVDAQTARQTALDELKDIRTRIAPALSDLDDRRAAARDCAAGVTHAGASLIAVQARMQAAGRAKDLSAMIVAAKAEQATSERAALSAKARWLSLRESRLAGIAAELAGQLADGQDCPVCGATEHPRLARPTRTTVTPADEQAAVDHHEQLAEVARHVTDQVIELQAEFEVCSALTSGVTLTAVRRELASAVSADAAARAAADQLPVLIAEHAELLAGQLEIVEQITELNKEQSADRASATELQARLVTARMRLDGARGQDPSLRLRRERLTALADAAEAIEQAWSSYIRTRASLASAGTRLDERLQRSGFANSEAATAALVEEEIRKGLAERIREHEDAQTRVAAELIPATEELASALAELRIYAPDQALDGDVPGDVGGDRIMLLAGRIREIRAALEAEHVAAECARDRAVGGLSRVRGVRSQLGELQILLDQAVAECSPLREASTQAGTLAALAAGGGANVKKMRLRSYVLAARLEQVARAATARLRQMSSGRYGFVHSADLRGGNRRSGLSVDILDSHTGTQRPTKTLSGGESFMAALALALGLADVVTAESGGITLDTLYVDEGFGGLDPDSLDAVMTVLDELRQSGRVVGIVSHVEELRTRVPMQLHIQASAQGSTLDQIDEETEIAVLRAG